MDKKRCSSCSKTKLLTEFYVLPGAGDGRGNRCKECCKEAARRNYRDNIEAYKAYEKMRAGLPHRIAARKNYSQTEGGKIARMRGSKAYWERNPQKRAAH